MMMMTTTTTMMMMINRHWNISPSSIWSTSNATQGMAFRRGAHRSMQAAMPWAACRHPDWKGHPTSALRSISAAAPHWMQDSNRCRWEVRNRVGVGVRQLHRFHAVRLRQAGHPTGALGLVLFQAFHVLRGFCSVFQTTVRLRRAGPPNRRPRTRPPPSPPRPQRPLLLPLPPNLIPLPLLRSFPPRLRWPGRRAPSRRAA